MIQTTCAIFCLLRVRNTSCSIVIYTMYNKVYKIPPNVF
jgi:hypothetical protein